MAHYDAVKVGGLHRETRSKKVVKPKFTTDFPGIVIPEGVDELTLQAHEEGVLRTLIDTSIVGPKMGASFSRRRLARFLPRPFSKKLKGQREAVYHYKDLHQAVKSKKSG